MSERSYRVRLDAFEGPLDLLLHLVKTNEVDIYHLPIKTITDQYLEYLGMMEELNLDVAGEYLVMAATMMYLKSRLLLPVDEEEEEEGEVDETAADLVRQLAEYQRYREVAEELRDRVLLGRDVFRREPLPPQRNDAEQPELAVVDMANLLEALRRVLVTAATRQPHTMVEEECRVSDCVRLMISKLRGSDRVEFQQLFEEANSRGFIIATFVGLLELIKLRVIEVEQECNNGPIFVSLTEHDVDDALLALAETYGQQVETGISEAGADGQ